MTKLVFMASLLPTITACLDHTDGPLEQVTGTHAYRDGSVTSAWAGGGDLQNVTVAATDVGGDQTIVNSETYARFDHGFKLELPGGHYAINVTDAAHHVIATYPDVVVDGGVTVGTPTTLAPQASASR